MSLLDVAVESYASLGSTIVEIKCLYQTQYHNSQVKEHLQQQKLNVFTRLLGVSVSPRLSTIVEIKCLYQTSLAQISTLDLQQQKLNVFTRLYLPLNMFYQSTIVEIKCLYQTLQIYKICVTNKVNRLFFDIRFYVFLSPLYCRYDSNLFILRC